VARSSFGGITKSQGEGLVLGVFFPIDNALHITLLLYGMGVICMTHVFVYYAFASPPDSVGESIVFGLSVRRVRSFFYSSRQILLPLYPMNAISMK